MMEQTELRKGYYTIEAWYENGMKKSAEITFTEGDLRLAAQLIEKVHRDAYIKGYDEGFSVGLIK